jgi:hypothetical protein
MVFRWPKLLLVTKRVGRFFWISILIFIPITFSRNILMKRVSLRNLFLVRVTFYDENYINFSWKRRNIKNELSFRNYFSSLFLPSKWNTTLARARRFYFSLTPSPTSTYFSMYVNETIYHFSRGPFMALVLNLWDLHDNLW